MSFYILSPLPSTSGGLGTTVKPTAGQVPIGNADGTYTPGTPTGGTVTSVTGSGNIASSGGSTPNITFTGTLPTANGGTNLGGATPFTSNGVVYASSTSALATGSALTFDGTNFTVGGSAYGGSTIGARYTTPASGATQGFLGATDGTKAFQLQQTGSAYSYLGVGANELWYYTNGSYSALTFGSDGAVPIKFVSNGGERMRLDTSGNLLVSTNSFALSNSNSIMLSGSTGGALYAQHASGTASGTIYSVFVYNGGVIGSITQNGTTGVLYNITSDYRLKTVIGAVTDSGSRIDALQPVEYTWNSNGSRTRGFLAHQFQEVYAGSVSGTKDAVDSEGKPVYQAMQASTSEVIADLVAEIQSLRIRIAQLEAK